MDNTDLIADVCQQARRDLPDIFAGKSDSEIIAELMETIRKARQAGGEVQHEDHA